MFLLYILLIIIAIGVLLASEAGQSFLGLLIKPVIIGGLLFLGFWIIIIAITFFTSDTGQPFAWYLISIILLLGLIVVDIVDRKDKKMKLHGLTPVVSRRFNESIKTTNFKNMNFESGFFNLIQDILLRDFGKIKSVCYNTWKYHKGWLIFIVVFMALNIYLRYFAY